MKIKILFLIFILILSSIINNAYAINYLLGYSAVDEGEIRWGGTTKYSTEWNNSISMWNNYGNGRVNIAPDTISTYEDLTIEDVYRSDSSWGARYLSSPGSDDIQINKYILDGDSPLGTFSSSQKQHTIGHELGHALGLAHHSITGNVMRTGGIYNYTTLGTQDKLDYDYLYSN